MTSEVLNHIKRMNRLIRDIAVYMYQHVGLPKLEASTQYFCLFHFVISFFYMFLQNFESRIKCERSAHALALLMKFPILQLN